MGETYPLFGWFKYNIRYFCIPHSAQCSFTIAMLEEGSEFGTPYYTYLHCQKEERPQTSYEGFKKL